MATAEDGAATSEFETTVPRGVRIWFPMVGVTPTLGL